MHQKISYLCCREHPNAPNLMFLHCFFLFYFVVSVFILIFAARNVKADRIMEVKKVTYEEALARFKRSLEIKHAAQKRMEEEWNRRGIKGTIVSL